MKTQIYFTSLLICLLIFTQQGHAQVSSEQGKGAIGLGLGLSYGGIGGRIGYNVAQGATLFLGLGYNLESLGINGGIYYAFPSTKQAQFYLTGMYGSNAVSIVSGAPEYTDTYYGPSFGAGIKVNSSKDNGNFWDFGLLVPARSSKYHDTVDAINNDPRIVEFSEAWPVLIVVGYNFGL